MPPIGLLSDVLNYILQHAKDLTSLSPTTPSADGPSQNLSAALSRKMSVRSGVGYSPSSMESVFVESFKFLKSLARKNVEVQER